MSRDAPTTVAAMDGSFVPVGPRRTFEGAVEQIAERIRLGELAEATGSRRSASWPLRCG